LRNLTGEAVQVFRDADVRSTPFTKIPRDTTISSPGAEQALYRAVVDGKPWFRFTIDGTPGFVPADKLEVHKP
jgi:hypothetical protein